MSNLIKAYVIGPPDAIAAVTQSAMIRVISKRTKKYDIVSWGTKKKVKGGGFYALSACQSMLIHGVPEAKIALIPIPAK